MSTLEYPLYWCRTSSGHVGGHLATGELEGIEFTDERLAKHAVMWDKIRALLAQKSSEKIGAKIVKVAEIEDNKRAFLAQRTFLYKRIRKYLRYVALGSRVVAMTQTFVLVRCQAHALPCTPACCATYRGTMPDAGALLAVRRPRHTPAAAQPPTGGGPTACVSMRARRRPQVHAVKTKFSQWTGAAMKAQAAFRCVRAALRGTCRAGAAVRGC